MEFDKTILLRAIEIARNNIAKGGGPFGAVIVLNNQIIAEAGNTVVLSSDPTAHAEVNAIRKACEQVHSHELKNAILYSSCEPCPMCLSAIYWSRISKVYFAASRYDAAHAGFDDEFLYKELNKPLEKRTLYIKQLDIPESTQVFDIWNAFEEKTLY